MKFRPLEDRVLIKPDVIAFEEETVTSSGVVAVKHNHNESERVSTTGTVVAVGEGKFLNTGVVITPQVSVGDKVTWSKFIGSNINIDNVSYLIMRSSDIVGIIS